VIRTLPDGGSPPPGSSEATVVLPKACAREERSGRLDRPSRRLMSRRQRDSDTAITAPSGLERNPPGCPSRPVAKGTSQRLDDCLRSADRRPSCGRRYAEPRLTSLRSAPVGGSPSPSLNPSRARPFRASSAPGTRQGGESCRRRPPRSDAFAQVQIAQQADLASVMRDLVQSVQREL